RRGVLPHKAAAVFGPVHVVGAAEVGDHPVVQVETVDLLRWTRKVSKGRRQRRRRGFAGAHAAARMPTAASTTTRPLARLNRCPARIDLPPSHTVYRRTVEPI